jgi:hypothetical protein
MELIRRFSPEAYAGALEAWAFLGATGKQPVAASAFGDLFLRDGDGCWFLDLLGGTLTRDWASAEELQAALNTPEGQSRYLMAELVGVASEQGLEPGPTEILSFRVPPMLGGELSLENLEVADFAVTADVFGQIHEQLRDLPPGTPITGIMLS